MQLHLLSQMTGFDHSTVRCASIWVFQSAYVSGSLPSLLNSALTAGNGTSSSEQRQCLCSLLLPAQAECKRTWWGKGPLFHSASHKPPIKLPVSKHSPTPSSFHAIYSMHTRNTNWTKPCQSHFLSKGLCKQNQLVIIMCVVLTACKAFTPSAEMTVFPLWPTTPSSKQFLYTGVREEVLLSSLIPTRKHSSHTVLHHQSNLMAVLCISCNQHLTNMIVWQTSNSRMHDVKGGSSDMHCNPSLCQPVPLEQFHCQIPPKIRSEPTWETRPDGYTGKMQLIQVKHYCDWDCNLPCFANLRPEEHINKY